MHDTDMTELGAMIRNFSHAMLVTHSESGELRSRPMAIAACEDDGRLWFVTQADSAKLDELADNPHCNVSCQDGRKFLSISGSARPTRDPEKIRAAWSEEQRAWFDEGRGDPNLILLEIVPSYAEFWDRTGVEGFKFLLAEARALIAGEKLEDDPSLHRKIKGSGARPGSHT